MTLDTQFLSNPLSAWLKGLITAVLVWLILTLSRHFILKLTIRTHKEGSLLHQITHTFSQVTIIVIALANAHTDDLGRNCFNHVRDNRIQRHS